MGTWTGTAQRGTRSVPFTLAISGAAGHLEARFLDGKEKLASYPATFTAGHLVVDFGDFANRLDATITEGAMTGTFGGHVRPMEIAAHLVPDISGDWLVDTGDQHPKGEAAWSLHVTQSGADATAVIQRIDGDTGTLYGTYAEGAFALSRFASSGPDTTVLTPQPDGTLRVGRMLARRPAAARAASLGGPEDPVTHTRMADARQPLTFRFQDLDGGWVSSADARFHRKVLLIAIGGSWCPNCHDEAPWLNALYRQYHARGLEVVAVDFEEDAAQITSLTRLRAYIARYQFPFPVLYAGATSGLNAAFPQVENLNCWPTTFIVGRDGLVKQIHAGFASAANAVDHQALVTGTQSLIERLLATR